MIKIKMEHYKDWIGLVSLLRDETSLNWLFAVFLLYFSNLQWDYQHVFSPVFSSPLRMNEPDNGKSDGKKTKQQHQQQKPTKFQLFEISPPLTPATASMKSHYCVYEPCATSPSLSLSLSLTHNVVTLYKIQLCLNILFWLTENYIVLPVSLTVYQPCLYVYPLFQDLFFLSLFFLLPWSECIKWLGNSQRRGLFIRSPPVHINDSAFSPCGETFIWIPATLAHTADSC